MEILDWNISDSAGSISNYFASNKFMYNYSGDILSSGIKLTNYKIEFTKRSFFSAILM